MNVLRKTGNAIARFMYGRNGMDQLNLVLMWVVLILDVVTMLVQRNHAAVSMVLWWGSGAGWVYVLGRMFCKKLSKRRGENQKFVNWVWRMKSSRAGAKERHADKDHKYFTCKNCKTICRVPVGKGKIIITCPKCGAQIHAKT